MTLNGNITWSYVLASMSVNLAVAYKIGKTEQIYVLSITRVIAVGLQP